MATDREKKYLEKLEGLNYLDVSKDIEELKCPINGAKEKTLAGASIAGKGVANFGIYLLKEGPSILEKMKANIEAEKRRRGG